MWLPARPDTFSLGMCNACQRRTLQELKLTEADRRFPCLRASSQTLCAGQPICLVPTSFWHAWQRPKVLCRPDTFSLGVCNGCQLMALLGWVPGGDLPDTQQPRFVHNASGRFECRWATVEIRPSPSVLLKAGAYECPYCQCSRDMSPQILLL